MWMGQTITFPLRLPREHGTDQLGQGQCYCIVCAYLRLYFYPLSTAVPDPFIQEERDECGALHECRLELVAALRGADLILCAFPVVSTFGLNHRLIAENPPGSGVLFSPIVWAAVPVECVSGACARGLCRPFRPEGVLFMIYPRHRPSASALGCFFRPVGPNFGGLELLAAAQKENRAANNSQDIGGRLRPSNGETLQRDEGRRIQCSA
jgi:hypothetical protein